MGSKSNPYNSNVYQLMRAAVLFVDGAECAISGVVSPSNEVHHIDFNPFNNHPENLIVLSKSVHSLVTRTNTYLSIANYRQHSDNVLLLKYYKMLQHHYKIK